MKMESGRRALDKVYKRRDRYDIPDWQRDKVWDTKKKQDLIDSILRGWRLPKFYFVKIDGDNVWVEDGQQRLNAIYSFFDEGLKLTSRSANFFKAEPFIYGNLKSQDFFDDFEIDFDLIETATEKELKEFFQRLQQGVALNSSEKLNAVESKLRNFCKSTAQHPFFAGATKVANTRFAHFDIVAKCITLEIEGLDSGLRLEDVTAVFVAYENFSSSSAVAKRARGALDLLHHAFSDDSSIFRTRTLIQSAITLTCRLVMTGKTDTHTPKLLKEFFDSFISELADQVELGQAATDSDYLAFQRSVNANVRGSAKLRQEILLRKLLRMKPSLATIFDPTLIIESGVNGRVAQLSDSIASLIHQINSKHEAKEGRDLFKATNKTSVALSAIRKTIRSLPEYKDLIDHLYFLFKESVGERIKGEIPEAFRDANILRTELRHDVDHGDEGKVRAKRKRARATFAKYSGEGTPDTIDANKLVLAQCNLLGAIEGDLRILLSRA